MKWSVLDIRCQHWRLWNCPHTSFMKLPIANTGEMRPGIVIESLGSSPRLIDSICAAGEYWQLAPAFWEPALRLHESVQRTLWASYFVKPLLSMASLWLSSSATVWRWDLALIYWFVQLIRVMYFTFHPIARCMDCMQYTTPLCMLAAKGIDWLTADMHLEILTCPVLLIGNLQQLWWK